MHLIKQQYIDYLKLNPVPHHQAIQYRLKQLAGSNNFNDQQLMQAYTNPGFEHQLIKKDNPKLQKIASKLALIAYFLARQ